jgi:hypothetical protein
MATKKLKTPTQKEVKQNVNKKTATALHPLGFSTTSQFLGYRAKEDVTNLPPGYMVSPSQNVFMNTQGLVQTRKGYQLYGQTNTGGTGILGSYDFLRGSFGDRSLRYGNGKLQYAYTAVGGDSWNGIPFTKGQVYWIDLLTNQPLNPPSFTTWLSQNNTSYSTNESMNIMLMVNQQSNITEWGGAVGTIAGASNNSIVLSSTTNPNVIEIICNSSVTSLSGSTTTAGNSVTTGSYVNAQGQTLYGGFITMPNKPANNDTLTLIINGTSIVTTFLTVLTYNYDQVEIGTDAPTTLSYLLGHFNNPSSSVQNEYGPVGGGRPLLPYLSFNVSMPLQGSTTTVGNSVLQNQGTTVLVMPVNPANGDTMTVNMNGVNETITFVSVIGTNPGNVLIAGTPALTQTNAYGLLHAPTTTNSTQVAFGATNALIVGSFTSSQTSTITLNPEGVNNTAILQGFYSQKSSRAVVINGNPYTYSGGESTNTLTGVLPSPAAEVVGSVVHQLPITTPNSAMTSLPATFRNDVLSALGGASNGTSSVNGGQIFVASYLSNNVFKSKIDSYTDYSQSSPRQPGEGYTFPLPGLFTSMAPQANSMYASSGYSLWSRFDFTESINQSTNVAAESVSIVPLKAGVLQGCLNQNLLVNIGNDLAFVTNEPTVQTLGLVAGVNTDPQLSNISDSIKNDMDAYGTAGFLGGFAKYWKYYIYFSLPTLGRVIRYNIAQGWWESPFIQPISSFSIINGQLYGHSSLTDESYQLESGTNDNGNPFQAIAAFSYENFGDRVEKKVFNEWYIEGYISENTTLSALTKFELGGFGGIQTFQVSGTGNYPLSPSATTIFQTIADGSIGKNPIGLEPIGSVTDSLLNLPKFRIIFTLIPVGFYEYQPYFTTNDIDFQWAILAYGSRIKEGNSPMDIRI